MTANAEVITYDFYENIPFCKDLMEQGYSGNYDFIDKTGTTVNTDKVMMNEKVSEGFDEDGKEIFSWKARTDAVISLKDGLTYYKQEDGSWKNETVDPDDDDNVMVSYLDTTVPFIVWGEKGPARTILMGGWGSLDAWVEAVDKDNGDAPLGYGANYNAYNEADWTPCKNGLAFLRNANSGSREDTYIQFPEVDGNATMTIWAVVQGVGGAKDYCDELRIKVVPVVNGEDQPAFSYVRALTAAEGKHYFKLTPADLDLAVDGEGNRVWADAYKGAGKVSYKIGAHKHQVGLMKVEFNTEGAGVAAVAADADDACYNLFGQKVDASYKGIVIRGGKKFIQK